MLIKVDVELYIQDRLEFGLTHRRKVIIRLQFGTFDREVRGETRERARALLSRNFITFTTGLDKMYAFILTMF